MNDKNIGSSFDSFLHEESILENATEMAIARIVDWLGAKALKDFGSDDWLRGSVLYTVPRSIQRFFSHIY